MDGAEASMTPCPQEPAHAGLWPLSIVDFGLHTHTHAYVHVYIYIHIYIYYLYMYVYVYIYIYIYTAADAM